MEIEIKECNNIKLANVNIEQNKLNIKYAINGTGKSTIAKAIYSKIKEPEKLSTLKPFKELHNENVTPEVNISEEINDIMIFNEDYVNSYIFKKDELVENSFEIFIKDENYLKHQTQISELIKDIKDLVSENESIKQIAEILENFINDYKATKSGYSGSGVLGKGLAKGNKIKNIPSELAVYSPFLKSENPVSWLKWQIAGKNYLNISNICPYCTSGNIDSKKTVIEKIQEEFEPKYVEHLNKMVLLLEHLSEFTSEDVKVKLLEIKNNVSGISSEQKTYLNNIYSDIETLYSRIKEIQHLGFEEFKDIDDINKKLNGMKIDITFLRSLNSPKMKNICASINNAIEQLQNKGGLLKGQVILQKRLIAEKILTYKSDINHFLEYAGYKYSVDIILKEELYKLVLYHSDNSEKEITDGNNTLSYGERNAFALVLFMYDALKRSPNLIILDDPISSFDTNKKFAILNKLFVGGNNFHDKTVLLLTHDFNVVIDSIYNFGDKITAKASFLVNNKGDLAEKKINRNNILSYKQIAITNIHNNNIVSSLIYLRRLFEFEGEKNMGYQLLSNLFHKRQIPVLKNNEKYIEMSDEEKLSGSNEIKYYLSDFSYSSQISSFRNYSFLIDKYKITENGYEKLQIFRLLNVRNPEIGDYEEKYIFETDDNIFRKFVNESFHIENDYLFQLNPIEYQLIPSYIIEKCDEYVSEIIKMVDNGKLK